MKRPQTYKDRLNIYRACISAIGFTIEVRWRCKEYPWGRPCDGRSFPIDRSLWRLIHRCERIRKRLDVENEIKDSSWCNAMMEMIFADPTQ